LISKLNLTKFFIKFSFFKKFLDVYKLTDIKHSFLTPWATYSPWINDKDFQALFEQIKKHTLVDLYRCYQLWAYLAEASKSGKGDILEVGVWRGGTSALLATRANKLDLDAITYIADTFEGVVKAGDQDTNYKGKEHSDTNEQIVTSLLKKVGAENYEILKGVFPDSLKKDISSSFIFCHIDVDTFESARDVFNWVFPRLNVRGVVVFDDYGFYNCTGVTRYVNELKKRSDLIFHYNLSGQAVIIKI
jgi:O-methyltransferase